MSNERLSAAIEEQAHLGPTIPSTMESAWEAFRVYSTLKPSVHAPKIEMNLNLTVNVVVPTLIIGRPEAKVAEVLDT